MLILGIQSTSMKPARAGRGDESGQTIAERSAEASFDEAAASPADEPALTLPLKRADALVAMADLAMMALAADGKPACIADKYQVIVHV